MDLIKAFKNNDTTSHVTIRGTHEEPLLRASDIGEVLGMTNIRQSIQDFDNTEKRGVSITDAIGRIQETTFLTEKGLYKLVFKSRKPIAKQFTDWVCEVIKEIRLKGKYELEQRLADTEQKLRLKDFQKDKEIEFTLLTNFRNKRVFYLILILNDNIIKFGISTEINNRIEDHRSCFGKDNIILKHVFETMYNKEFEQIVKIKLKQHIIEKIYKKNNITELIQLTSEFTYENLKIEIEKLKTDFNSEFMPNLIKENTELHKENSELKLKVAETEIKQKNVQLNKLTEPIIQPTTIKSNQDRFQLYDKNLNLLKTYETIQDACNENVYYKNAVPQSIQRSAKNNTLYRNFRFWKISRDQPIVEYEIPETFALSKEQTYQRVVQFKDNRIVDVYSCTKDASEKLFKMLQDKQFVPKNNKLLRSTISQINKTITNALSIHTNHLGYEHHWYRESDVPENLLEQFENFKIGNVLPEVSIHKNNKRVYKFDSENNLIKTYHSITDARNTEKISEKTMNKYITEKTFYNSHYFSFTN